MNLVLDEMVIDDDYLKSRRKYLQTKSNLLFKHTNSGVFDCDVTRIGLDKKKRMNI